MNQALRCDLFCTVIDNFGDAGVCWRLARQLAREHGWHVRLLIDAPAALFPLLPAFAEQYAARRIDTALPLPCVDGVTLDAWPAPLAPCSPAAVADVVIEAFGCDLPESYLDAMAQRARHPVWINLEYLSAEDWVQGCHLGKSRHPQLGLERTFFFPGIVPGTGGLLREQDLEARRTAFLRDPAAQGDLCDTLGLDANDKKHILDRDAIVITLFAYENRALSTLLQQWSRQPQPIIVLVPEGRISHDVAAYFGISHFNVGERARQGTLHALAIPFVDQLTYDRLLWLADLNFVRGEDSFVRAQWAERAFVWQIYPQADNAHHSKLDAVLQHYTARLSESARQSVQRFWHAWNAVPHATGATQACQDQAQPAWDDFWQHHAELGRLATEWAATLRRPGSLARNLAEFAESQLK